LVALEKDAELVSSETAKTTARMLTYACWMETSQLLDRGALNDTTKRTVYKKFDERFTRRQQLPAEAQLRG